MHGSWWVSSFWWWSFATGFHYFSKFGEHRIVFCFALRVKVGQRSKGSTEIYITQTVVVFGAASVDGESRLACFFQDGLLKSHFLYVCHVGFTTAPPLLEVNNRSRVISFQRETWTWVYQIVSLRSHQRTCWIVTQAKYLLNIWHWKWHFSDRETNWPWDPLRSGGSIFRYQMKLAATFCTIRHILTVSSVLKLCASLRCQRVLHGWHTLVC